jgi:hypothetical protein
MQTRRKEEKRLAAGLTLVTGLLVTCLCLAVFLIHRQAGEIRVFKATKVAAGEFSWGPLLLVVLGMIPPVFRGFACDFRRSRGIAAP